MAALNYISGNIIDIINRQIYKGRVYFGNGYINRIEHAPTVKDQYILPGFVDSHIHIESSLLVPAAFSKLAVRHGVISTVSDPHEIANVLGEQGVNFMINNGNAVPFKFYFGVPSCVPATPFETSGAVIDSKKVEELISRSDLHYLGEMMNFPGVINEDHEIKAKILASKKHNKPVDGHAPGLRGSDLKKYISAGISTDHECNSLDEGREKIENGMKIQIRQGSAAKSFDTLAQLIDEYPHMVMLCSDDAHPDDLLYGSIDTLIRHGVIDYGIDLYNILRAAIYNPITHYGLDIGLLREGDPADFIVINNLSDFKVTNTYINGKHLYDGNSILFDAPESELINTFSPLVPGISDITISQKGSKLKIICARDGELCTEAKTVIPPVENNNIVSSVDRDILKIVLVNRYSPQQPSVAFIQNFGLKRGAIATSVSHDSHNIVCIGTNDEDIIAAIKEINLNKGGMVSINKSDKEIFPLPVAGLMTNQAGSVAARQYEKVKNKAYEFGTTFSSPFMTLSFMALLVIPELKISDKGLFDVNQFNFTSLQE